MKKRLLAGIAALSLSMVALPAVYATPFAVEVGQTVQLEVAGAKKTITSVDAPPAVTTESGTAPELPGTVVAHYSDGSTAEVAVTWEDIEPEAYSYRGGGQFTVSGTVGGFAGGVEATVKVIPAMAMEVVNVEPVETVEGVAPKLPGTADVSWSNGDVSTESVVFSSINPDEYAAPGKFIASGTAAGLPINLPITVVAATIASLDSPEQVVTESGTAPVLPETVVAHWTNGAVTDEEVAWEEIDPAAYSYRGGGTFTVSGTVAGAEESATVEVKVIPAKALEVMGVTGVETVEGIAPKLPETAEVSWSNGDVSTESIAWAGVNADEYAAPGEFIASGTAAGLPINLPVTVTVTVVEQAGEAPDQGETLPAPLEPDEAKPYGNDPKLPHTGASVFVLGLAALALMGAGMALRRRAR